MTRGNRRKILDMMQTKEHMFCAEQASASTRSCIWISCVPTILVDYLQNGRSPLITE